MAASTAYPKLPNERSIRVIALHGAANPDEVIRFDITTVCLDESPHYEALSYTWGGQSLDRLVLANGRKYHITQNAEAAMKRLRPRRPRGVTYLWVDAICINQNDTGEKNSQVKMMNEIYAKARRVNMWLGEGTDLTAFGMRWIRWTSFPSSQLLRFMMKCQRIYHMSTNLPQKVFFGFWIIVSTLVFLSVVMFILLAFIPLRNLPRFEDIKRKMEACQIELASREYWQRVWTVQEACANPSRFVICGSSKAITMESFYAGIGATRLMYTTGGTKEGNIPFQLHIGFNSVETVPYMETRTEVLNSLCTKKATLEVDKIFAMRALFPQSLGTMPIDYSKSAKETFTSAARLFIEASRRVEFFGYACHDGRTDGFPSWVPPWTTPTDVPDWLRKYGPKEISKEAIVSQDDDMGVLKLKGLRVDEATAAISEHLAISPSTSYTLPTDIVAAREVLRLFGAWVDALATAVERESCLARFAALLAAVSDKDEEEEEELCSWLSRVGHEGNDNTEQLSSEHDDLPSYTDENTQVFSFAKEFFKLIGGRFLFTTQGGRVGMSTLSPHEGDEIALLTGESLLYLIRRCPDHPGRYTLVSPCWLSGAVKGEEWPWVREGDDTQPVESKAGLEDLEYIELV